MGFGKICKETMQQAFERVKDAYRQNRNEELSIHVDYWIENNMQFGARSSMNKDKYKFSVNSEVFKRIDDLLYTLLEGTLIENTEVREKFYKIVSLGDCYNRERAKVYSQLLFVYASEIIINHELGHILNGHLAYIADENNMSESLLFMNSEDNNLNPIESQILEMDADAFSASRMIDVITFDENINTLNNKHDNIIKDKNHTFIISVIASVIVFSIQGLGIRRDSMDLNKVKYLPLRTRLFNYIGCLSSAYKVMEKSEALKYDYISLIPLLTGVEGYVNAHTLSEYSFSKAELNIDNNKNELDNQYIEHWRKLNRYWSENIREKLLEYAYFELAQ